MTEKLEFKLDEYEEAVQKMVYLKLVQQWSGVLKLEKLKDKLYISQFSSSNSWTENHETIYTLEDYVSWSDFTEDIGISEEDEIWVNLTNQEKWDQVNVHDMIENDIMYVERILEELE